MIKKRLIKFLPGALKHIIAQVFWNWMALACQIVIVFNVAGLLTLPLYSHTESELFRIIGKNSGFILGAIILRLIFDRLAVRSSYKASTDVKRILREKIYDKLLRLGLSYREKISTAAVVQMSVEGVEQLEIYFGKYLSQLIYSLLAPITLFIFLSRVDMKSSLVLLLCVPLIPISIVAVQKIAGRLLKKYWGVYTGLGDSFLENLQGLTTLKIYNADKMKAEEMDEEAQHFRKITMRVLTMQLNSTSVMDIIAYGGAAIGMVVALKQFLAGAISAEGTLMICLLASEFFIPLRLLGSFFHIAMNGMAASDNIFDFLDLEEPEEGANEIKGIGRSIAFNDVSFRYEENRQILDKVNLELMTGSLTSLVGTSGSGKSTIAGILIGRNRGYEGSINIDDCELSTVTEKSLMETVTMVSANSYIFKGTVRENLLMGNPNATDDEMRNVLSNVNLEGFLDEQQGLDTTLLEQGSNLSGGQKQRLALARALLHETPVYIFDEATSNIDVESEEMIMNVIHHLAREKTVLLISHRLANVTNSDNIYVLKDGKIEESGTHMELMSKEGRYRELYTAQKKLESYGKGREM